ncbi:MAG: ABC transporter ATP-binding protein [Vicinamibacterales bacterium]
MTPSLRLERVAAGYGPRRVLTDLTLEVPAGTLTVLLGPSGCGKTTVLNVVSGLLPATSGQVWLDREPLTDVPVERRGIGVVFQKASLFPHLTVADNVAFGLEMRGIAPARRRAAAEEALRLVQLDGFGDRRPSALSGGQEQRVALARALVTKPRVLLLDEPLSALDEGLRNDMRALLRGLQRQLGVTTLFITHDQREAVDIADQVAMMLDGTIAQAGPPRLFYTEPASEQVARFFGWAILPRSAVRESLPGDDGTVAQLVAFHPSSATLCSHREAMRPDAAAIAVVVERVIDLGAEVRAVVRLPTGDSLEISQFMGPDYALAEGGAHLVVPMSGLRSF